VDSSVALCKDTELARAAFCSVQLGQSVLGHRDTLLLFGGALLHLLFQLLLLILKPFGQRIGAIKRHACGKLAVAQHALSRMAHLLAFIRQCQRFALLCQQFASAQEQAQAAKLDAAASALSSAIRWRPAIGGRCTKAAGP
jgi:hypothetical protein